MSKCTERGCRNIEKRCVDCGRLVVSYELKCNCMHAIDGYETYFIDENTIGVRPLWISVKDKLPTPYELVLVYGDEGVFRGYRDESEDYPSWNCSPMGSYAGDARVFGITHWMPLPSTEGLE